MPPTLHNCFVSLAPLTLADAPALFAPLDATTLQFFPMCPRVWSLDAFVQFLRDALSDPARWTFTVRSPQGNVVGSTSYLDMRPAHRGLEIGATWYVPSARGTPINPAAKLLLLEHAFDVLACQRVQLKCDARNVPSQRAIAKLGATYEGTLRKHIVMPDGFIRDTVFFSIIADEWPAVRAQLRQRLRLDASE